jgi:hypothetical protein
VQDDVVAFTDKGTGGGAAESVGGAGDEDAGHGIILPPEVCWYRSAAPGRWPGEPVYRARAGEIDLGSGRLEQVHDLRGRACQWPVMISFTTAGRTGPDEYLAASSLTGNFPVEPPS